MSAILGSARSVSGAFIEQRARPASTGPFVPVGSRAVDAAHLGVVPLAEVYSSVRMGIVNACRLAIHAAARYLLGIGCGPTSSLGDHIVATYAPHNTYEPRLHLHAFGMGNNRTAERGGDGVLMATAASSASPSSSSSDGTGSVYSLLYCVGAGVALRKPEAPSTGRVAPVSTQPIDESRGEADSPAGESAARWTDADFWRDLFGRDDVKRGIARWLRDTVQPTLTDGGAYEQAHQRCKNISTLQIVRSRAGILAAVVAPYT